MIMLHHIPEEHGVEVRLQDFDFFHLAFFENNLWKTALLAITAEGDRHLCLASFAKWICLGALERQIFLETQGYSRYSSGHPRKAEAISSESILAVLPVT